MKIRSLILLVAIGAALGSACSLILPFDPDGQPCDAAGKCLEGYGCVDGVCKKGAETPVDCSQCPAGDCVPGTKECLPNTCDYKICQAQYACNEDPSGLGPRCDVIPSGPANLGFGPCFDDMGCYGGGGSVRHCMIDAVATQSTGTTRGGICVEECGPNDTCTLTNAICRSFPVGDGGVTKVCLPKNTLTPCSSNGQCKRAGLVCTVFDNPATGPIEVCDSPMPNGAKPGEACVKRNNDGGTLCENGLCIPDPVTASSGTATCGQTCDSNSCVGEYCAQVEYQLPYNGEVIRYVPMCIPLPTNCRSCAAGPTTTCNADAPHCVPFNGESRCLGACTPDAGAFQCPANYQCTDLDGGGFFCTPLQGACP